MNYTLYADESGQSGIKKIRTDTAGGASRYMTMGGVLVPNEKRDAFRETLAEVVGYFGRKDLHCSKLNHNQIVRFAKVVADLDVTLFGVISLKETLGPYKEDIGGDDKLFYNKCAQYLLERVGRFLDGKGLSEANISVRFEEGGFDYNRLRGLIHACRKNPRHPATRMLKHINQNCIEAIPKADDTLLQLGDLLAHALYRCVDDGPSTYGVFETRYIRELRSRFFSNPSNGKVCGWGLYPVHTVSHIKADREVSDFLSTLRSDS